MPQKMLFRLCLFITQKVLNFHVFLLGASDGILPHTSSLKDANDRVTETSEALEEERRLLLCRDYTGERRTVHFLSAIFRGKN